MTEAVEISASPWRLEPVSATFHGRDVFAPVAARLACGAPLASAGTPLDPGELVALERSQPRQEEDALVAHVVAIDSFGNVVLDAVHSDVLERGLRLGDAVAARADAQAGPRRHGAHVQRRGGRRACSSTRTRAARWRWPSTAATPPRSLGLRAGDEVRLERA